MMTIAHMNANIAMGRARLDTSPGIVTITGAQIEKGLAVPSVPLPNNSDNDRSAAPSEFEQPGDGIEGTVDSSLNEAPRYCLNCERQITDSPAVTYKDGRHLCHRCKVHFVAIGWA